MFLVPKDKGSLVPKNITPYPIFTALQQLEVNLVTSHHFVCVPVYFFNYFFLPLNVIFQTCHLQQGSALQAFFEINCTLKSYL